MLRLDAARYPSLLTSTVECPFLLIQHSLGSVRPEWHTAGMTRKAHYVRAGASYRIQAHEGGSEPPPDQSWSNRAIHCSRRIGQCCLKDETFQVFDRLFDLTKISIHYSGRGVGTLSGDPLYQSGLCLPICLDDYYSHLYTFSLTGLGIDKSQSYIIFSFYHCAGSAQ